MKHWTQFLTEAGQIKRNGEDQISRMYKIRDMEKKLEASKLEYQEHEKAIVRLALNEWTLNEIIMAKHRAADDDLQNLIS